MVKDENKVFINPVANNFSFFFLKVLRLRNQNFISHPSN